MGGASEAAVRQAGAVPATIGVVDGAVRVGLSAAEVERFGQAGAAARKLGPRDLVFDISEDSPHITNEMVRNALSEP